MESGLPTREYTGYSTCSTNADESRVHATHCKPIRTTIRSLPSDHSPANEQRVKAKTKCESQSTGTESKYSRAVAIASMTQ